MNCGARCPARSRWNSPTPGVPGRSPEQHVHRRYTRRKPTARRVNGAIKAAAILRVGTGGVLAGNGLISCSVTNLGTVSPGGGGALGVCTVSNLFFSDARHFLELRCWLRPAIDQIRGISTYDTGGSSEHQRVSADCLETASSSCLTQLPTTPPSRMTRSTDRTFHRWVGT